MIAVFVEADGLETMIQQLRWVSEPNFQPLAETIRGIMIQDNRDGLLSGIDQFGDAMTPLEDSTIRRGRGGDGPPLVPRGDASRAISDYQVDIQDVPAGKELTGSWPNTPFIHIHATGTRHMASRDPVGIRPDGEEKIRVALEDFASSLIREAVG